MKPNLRNILLHVSYLIFFYMSLAAQTFAKTSAADIPVLGEGYYLVVGAFNISSNAVRYSSAINKKGEQSKVGKSPHKNIYYVYVLATMDLELAKAKWVEYRNTIEFADAWVFKNVKIPDDEFIEIGTNKSVSATGNQQIFADPTDSPDRKAPKIEIKVEEEQPALSGEGFNYIFNAVNATTLKEVPGVITVVDALRNKAVTSLNTNEPVIVPDPGTAEKKVVFICDIFGFVKQQVALNLENPAASSDPNIAIGEDGVTEVNFQLTRHNPGEIIVMFHVYFHNDAAIMKPESRYELNSLLDMMREDEALKIRIHGHTNGNSPGKIIKLRDGDTNFFEVTGNNIHGQGSAKDLSKERANVIKLWLMQQGIDERRMELKGWGGKKMLYDKKSEQAARNVRVEIELLKK